LLTDAIWLGFAQRCIALQSAAKRCKALHRAASRCIALHRAAKRCKALHRAASRCIALHRAASRCKALQSAASRCKALHRAAKRCLASDYIRQIPLAYPPRPRGASDARRKRREDVAATRRSAKDLVPVVLAVGVVLALHPAIVRNGCGRTTRRKRRGYAQRS
jgi:hypothetical protein